MNITSGIFKFTLDLDNKTAELSGLIDKNKEIDRIIVTGTLFYEGDEFTVTKIGNSAFAGCSGFTGPLVLPDNLEYLGEEAFSHCSGFTGDLVIPTSLIIFLLLSCSATIW